MTKAEKAFKAVEGGKGTDAPGEVETPQETAHSAAYTLRPLQARDLFKFAAIINKIGIKQFKSVFDSEAVTSAAKEAASGGGSVEAVGVQVIMDAADIILANVGRVESDLYGLLGDLSGMEPSQIETMPLGDFAGMVVDVVKADGFRDFFTQAQRLLK